MVVYNETSRKQALAWMRANGVTDPADEILDSVERDGDHIVYEVALRNENGNFYQSQTSGGIASIIKRVRITVPWNPPTHQPYWVAGPTVSDRQAEQLLTGQEA
jgi:hypothetical protein